MSITVELIPDVEMTDVSESGMQEKKDMVVIQKIKDTIGQIKKAVQSKELCIMVRALRSWSTTRGKINDVVLYSIVNEFYTHSSFEKDLLLSYLSKPTGEPKAIVMLTEENTNYDILPEIDGYIRLLVLVQLIDKEDYNKAMEFSDLLMLKLVDENKRTIYPIKAKAYFYHMRSYELSQLLHKIKGFLFSQLRSVTLQHDYEGQAVLTNCLLHYYLKYTLYNQADKFILKSVFPEQASNNQSARFLYYQGRIKAARLEYTAANTFIAQALHKAPQNSAFGFRQTLQKLSVTLKLLLGYIPERHIFREVYLRKALIPYFHLTQSVRLGNLKMFLETGNNYKDNFIKDGNYMLIKRLRHNVIKKAISDIGKSYSRITISYITQKLGYDSPEDVEFIISKAIKEGVIQGVIDAESGILEMKEPIDLYGTQEPQIAFNNRISFCLDLHKKCTKAMCFPEKAYGKDLLSAKESRKRDGNLAKELMENEDGFL